MPPAQVVHTDEPFALLWPAGHWPSHLASLEPPIPKRPAGHAWHFLLPHLPGAHVEALLCTTSSDSSASTWLLSQGMQPIRYHTQSLPPTFHFERE